MCAEERTEVSRRGQRERQGGGGQVGMVIVVPTPYSFIEAVLL